MFLSVTSNGIVSIDGGGIHLTFTPDCVVIGSRYFRLFSKPRQWHRSGKYRKCLIITIHKTRFTCRDGKWSATPISQAEFEHLFV